MDERGIRLEAEHRLIASVFAGIERSGDWFLIGHDKRATRAGWTPDPFPVAFHAQPGHPGQVPYGIYVPSSALVGGKAPDNFSATASNRPPFDGHWGVLSWQGDADGRPWIAKREIRKGANLLNYVITFEQRFRQGV